MIATVLLWGRSWWLPHRAEPLPFAESAHAAETLAAAWPEDSARRLRLIYQPDGFTTSAIACPQGSRSTLALALAAEYPALAEPGLAWSFEPILPAAEGFATLLHSETEPALFDLVAELAGRGFKVESAWPLATWLQAVPTEWSESGAFAVGIVSADHASAFAHANDGTRRVPEWRGERAVADFAAFAQSFLARDAGASVMALIADDATAATLDAALGSAVPAGLDVLTLSDALRRQAAIPSKHPGQLLPSVPLLTASRAAVAASVLFLATAAAVAALYVRDCVALRDETAARAARRESLQTEVAHLRDNRAAMAQWRADLAAFGSGPPCGAVLRELAASPPELALVSLRIAPEGFETEAGLAPPAPAKILENWTARMGRAGLPWRFHPNPPTADGMIQAQGAFSR